MRHGKAGLLTASLLCASVSVTATVAAPQMATSVQTASPTAAAMAEPAQRFKSAGLMVSFIELNRSDLGDALSYLLWAELTTTLGMADADYRLTPVALVDTGGVNHPLRDSYHVSAVAMASAREAPLTYWGVVRKSEDKLTLSTYISMRPQLRDSDLMLTAHRANDDVAVQASVTRMRYGFETSTQALASLFQRTLAAREQATLYAEPRQASAALAALAPGTVLQGDAMSGPWYHVKDATGRSGYVHIDQLKVVPAAVTARSAVLVLRDEPREAATSRSVAVAQGSLAPLDVVVDEKGGAWYRISAGGADGWVGARQIDVRFTLPSQHFLAGLYYLRAPEGAYQCQYRLAAEQFSRFIASGQSTEKNTNLATAHELFATSELRSSEACGRDEAAALRACSAAVELTPYDPVAYNLRAVGSLRTLQVTEPIVADLRSSVELDRQDPQTRALVGSVVMAAQQETIDAPPPSRREVERLYREMTWTFVAKNVARIRQEKHLAMESKGQRVAPDPVGGVILTFRNRTRSPLDLYVLENQREDKEPEGFYVQLSGGNETELHVAEGTYEIAVEGADPNVRPVYGAHDYAPRSHFSLDFQVTLNDAPLSAR
jgi:hypothetical protein